ncbi:Protein of unknown function [Pyronema omphalodes CBS 100304]|uniref:Uncharacterized protein n=1 Tax=Pyronema omphalodes (strain CBS 100304) TaxID=1076935 RepID=U4L4S0_PYROM|nr:Protein of unknown function [Pyronema omphalodes CBS 100304]
MSGKNRRNVNPLCGPCKFGGTERKSEIAPEARCEAKSVYRGRGVVNFGTPGSRLPDIIRSVERKGSNHVGQTANHRICNKPTNGATRCSFLRHKECVRIGT